MNTTAQPMPKLTRQSKINEVADFVLTYGKNLYSPMQRPDIERFIEEHMDYGTLLITRDRGRIIGVCRWNFENPRLANILDLIIHPEYRNRRVMKSMLIQGNLAFPCLRSIKFYRKKHKRITECLINDFLGGK